MNFKEVDRSPLPVKLLPLSNSELFNRRTKEKSVESVYQNVNDENDGFSDDSTIYSQVKNNIVSENIDGGHKISKPLTRSETIKRFVCVLILSHSCCYRGSINFQY